MTHDDRDDLDASYAVVRLYRTFSTRVLRELRTAFEADRADARAAGDRATERFCEGRLAIIAAEMQERGLE